MIDKMRTIEVELNIDSVNNSLHISRLVDQDVKILFTLKGFKTEEKFVIDFLRSCTLRFDK